MLADDHPVVYQGLQSCLARQDSLKLVGQAEIQAKRVWSKRLGSFPMVVVEFQQASRTPMGVDLNSAFTDPARWRGKENHVVYFLVVAFGVKVRNEIRQHLSNRWRRQMNPGLFLP
jgi:hypothetical protein